MERTIVILLSDTHSSMQVKGFKEYAYDGQGSAVMFDSGAVHRGHAAAGTVKVALFLKPRRPRPAEGRDTTHARGSADSMSVGPESEHGVASAEEESGIVTPVTVVAEAVEAGVAEVAAEVAVAADGVVDTTVDGTKTGEANGDRMKRKAEMQLIRTEEKLWRGREARSSLRVAQARGLHWRLGGRRAVWSMRW